MLSLLFFGNVLAVNILNSVFANAAAA